MVKIILDDDKMLFKGHTQPDICAAISSIMYTTVNLLSKYGDHLGVDVIEFTDNTEEDYVEISLLYFDFLTRMIIDNMYDMLKDLKDDNNEDKIELYCIDKEV